MPIFSRNPLLTEGEAIQTESTLGEAFGAGTYSMYEGVVGSLSRMDDIRSAEGTLPRYEAFQRDGRTVFRQRPLSPILDPEIARQKLRDNGLDQNLSIPESGIRQDTLDILMSRKRDELKRQVIMSQATGGSAVFANLSGALLGSFVDPTNIALAFVPVVGEAKYAQMLTRAGGVFGRTGVRVGVGGVEGLVGLAPVEALNYYAHQQQQSDYDAYDSMLAVAGGAFFGSALHGGAGLFSDVVLGGAKRFNQPTVVRNEPSLAGVVDAPGAAAPPALDMAARERLMVLDRLAEGRPVTRAQAEALDDFFESTQFKELFSGSRVVDDAGQAMPVFHGTVKDFEDFRVGSAVGWGEGIYFTDNRAYAASEYAGDGGRVIEAYVVIKNPWEGRGIPQGIENTKAWEGASRRWDYVEDAWQEDSDFVGASLRELGYDGIIAKSSNDVDGLEIVAFRSDQIILRSDGFAESLSPEVRSQLEADPFMPVRPFIAGLDQTTQAGALRMAIAQAVSGRPVDISPALYADAAYFSPESGFAAAGRNADLVDGADVEASKWADSIKPLDDDIDTARTQLADEEAFVNEMMDAAGIEMTEPFKRSINDAVLESKKQSAAARSAAMCMMRTGG